MFDRNSPPRGLFGSLLASGMLCLGGLTPQAVLADITAVFESEDGGMTIEYRDDNHVRMRTADNTFFVIRDGKGYMVSREGGEWLVIAVDDTSKMMGGGADDREFDLRDTGRTETIAGIKGRVYEYAERDSWTGDLGPTTEIVLSDDADVRAVYRGIMRTTGILTAMAGGQMENPGAPAIGDKGLLRHGNEWRLLSLNRNPIPDRHFSLPAEPRRMPGFGSPTGDTPRGAAAERHDERTPGWVEKEAQDIGRVAADEARGVSRDASNEVRENVRDGIRGLFRK